MIFSSFPYYNRYSRYGYRYPNYTPYINKVVTNQTANKTTNKIADETKEEKHSSLENSPLFQIFGIELYFDDILIVCLIFFLYQEGVKDETLFIALILLLLS